MMDIIGAIVGLIVTGIVTVFLAPVLLGGITGAAYIFTGAGRTERKKV